MNAQRLYPKSDAEIIAPRYAKLSWAPGYAARRDGTVWSCWTTQGEMGDSWHELMPIVDRDGYRRCTIAGKQEHVARVMLRAFVGEPPPKHEVRHFPDPDSGNNRIENLRWGTHRENIRDKVRGQRQAKGAGHGRAKLTELQVREIRRRSAAGTPGAVLAREFRMNPSTIRDIISRKIWAHVE